MGQVSPLSWRYWTPTSLLTGATWVLEALTLSKSQWYRMGNPTATVQKGFNFNLRGQSWRIGPCSSSMFFFARTIAVRNLILFLLLCFGNTLFYQTHLGPLLASIDFNLLTFFCFLHLIVWLVLTDLICRVTGCAHKTSFAGAAWSAWQGTTATLIAGNCPSAVAKSKTCQSSIDLLCTCRCKGLCMTALCNTENA